MKLVLRDLTEASIADLDKIRDDANEDWKKALKAKNRSSGKMARMENIISECTGRIRLLKILSNDG